MSCRSILVNECDEITTYSQKIDLLQLHTYTNVQDFTQLACKLCPLNIASHIINVATWVFVSSNGIQFMYLIIPSLSKLLHLVNLRIFFSFDLSLLLLYMHFHLTSLPNYATSPLTIVPCIYLIEPFIQTPIESTKTHTQSYYY